MFKQKQIGRWTMDRIYTEQVLKEIFSKYGVEIVRDQRRFGAALGDLLGQDHPDERIVFRYALTCPALEFAAGSITKESAQKAVERLEQEARMREQDAEFAVACTLSACGYNPEQLLAKHMPSQSKQKQNLAQTPQRPAQQSTAVPVSQNTEPSAAECFRNGESAEKRGDFREAAEWYCRAASQGHSIAAYNLGRYYEYGRKGVAKDDTQAADWYRQAAEAGHGEAACSLAWFYAKGQGVTLDYQKAKYWCKAARDHGYGETANRVEQFLHEQGEDQQKGLDCLRVARCVMNQGEKTFLGGLKFHSGVLQVYQDRLTFIKDKEEGYTDILWREVVKSYTSLRSGVISFMVSLLLAGEFLVGALLIQEFQTMIIGAGVCAALGVLMWVMYWASNRQIWVIVYPRKMVILRFGNKTEMKKILPYIKKGRKGRL